jgi:hypothetical protein
MVECVAALVGDAAGRPTVRTSDSLDIRIGSNRLGWKDFFFFFQTIRKEYRTRERGLLEGA